MSVTGGYSIQEERSVPRDGPFILSACALVDKVKDQDDDGKGIGGI